MKIEFCDLKRQYHHLKESIDSSISRVIDHGKFINGPEVKELEEKLSDYVGVSHAIGVSSGTDALLTSLMAYDVGEGDIVVTTPYTFAATAETISVLGAQVRFVDIDPKTFNIDCNKLEDCLETSDGVAGVVPVDLFGQAADYDHIERIAEKYGIFVLEDGAQSLGGEYNGKRNCSHGNIAATSFFPSKTLGCFGDGGMVFCDDDNLASKVRRLINHGQDNKYSHSEIGLNMRLDTIQAAILLAKFNVFEDEIEKRNETAKKYDAAFEDLGIRGLIQKPFVDDSCRSAFSQYAILTGNRDSLKEYLSKEEIPTAIYYPKPLSLQPAFSNLGNSEGDFPIAERISKRILNLPIDAYKTDEEIDHISDSVNDFFI